MKYILKKVAALDSNMLTFYPKTTDNHKFIDFEQNSY